MTKGLYEKTVTDSDDPLLPDILDLISGGMYSDPENDDLFRSSSESTLKFTIGQPSSYSTALVEEYNLVGYCNGAAFSDLEALFEIIKPDNLTQAKEALGDAFDTTFYSAEASIVESRRGEGLYRRIEEKRIEHAREQGYTHVAFHTHHPAAVHINRSILGEPLVAQDPADGTKGEFYVFKVE
jgi:hypothetical protein